MRIAFTTNGRFPLTNFSALLVITLNLLHCSALTAQSSWSQGTATQLTVGSDHVLISSLVSLGHCNNSAVPLGDALCQLLQVADLKMIFVIRVWLGWAAGIRA